MKTRPSSFDVCIVCALSEEARAFLEIVRMQSGNAVEKHVSLRYGYSYRLATLKNNKGELLKLHISWLPRYGPQEMALHLSHVLEECQPRIAIMTGICAGDAQRVQLGDLVVAERTFTYDNGNFTVDDDGRRVHLYDTQTYQLNANIQQFLGLFDDWQPLVADLKRPSSPSKHNGVQEPKEKREMIVCHIQPMASGNAVRTDNPFENIQAPVYKTVAIDMEGAAFGLVMSRHPLISWLIVKGVCDYADRTKNDTYHDYAARASALYALTFIQAYVTKERLPPSGGLVPSRQTKNQNNSHHSTSKPDFMKWRRSIFFVALSLIILLAGGKIYFAIHNTINSPESGSDTAQAQHILKQFCTDLANGDYTHINELIPTATLNNNKGSNNVANGWAAMEVQTCQPGTVLREGNTNVFIGTIIYSRINSPNLHYSYQIIINNLQGPWEITSWGSVDRTNSQETIALYCLALQTNSMDILHSLIPQSRWKWVQIAFFPDCATDSEPGVSCSLNLQILYIFGEGRRRSLFLGLIHGHWFIVDYEDRFPSNHSNCQDESSLPKISLVNQQKNEQMSYSYQYQSYSTGPASTPAPTNPYTTRNSRTFFGRNTISVHTT